MKIHHFAEILDILGARPRKYRMDLDKNAPKTSVSGVP
jgi:hypothetical protein